MENQVTNILPAVASGVGVQCCCAASVDVISKFNLLDMALAEITCATTVIERCNILILRHFSYLLHDNL